MPDLDPIPLDDDGSPPRPLPPQDHRPLLPEPLPVRLIAIADVVLGTLADPRTAAANDAFYGHFLAMAIVTPGRLYRADNVHLRLDPAPPEATHLTRDELRPTPIEIPDLRAAEKQLITLAIPYERLRGLHPAMTTLALSDPSGNPIELHENRRLY